MQAARHFIREHEMGKGILKRVDHFFTLLWKQYKSVCVRLRNREPIELHSLGMWSVL